VQEEFGTAYGNIAVEKEERRQGLLTEARQIIKQQKWHEGVYPQTRDLFSGVAKKRLLRQLASFICMLTLSYLFVRCFRALLYR
jgi:hypothetical protein